MSIINYPLSVVKCIETNNTEKKVLLISDNRGIYIPRDFYKNFDMQKWNIKRTNYLKSLYYPHSLNYWDCWDQVLNNAYFIDEKGMKWFLFQDGDLCSIRSDFNEENENE